MGLGLQLLTLSAAADVASQASDVAQGAIQNFAKLFSPESATTSSLSQSDLGRQQTDQLDQIQSAITDHLKRVGVPLDSAIAIEIQMNGHISVEAAPEHRLEIEDAIKQDDALVANLRQYAQSRSAGLESYFVHWPPLGPVSLMQT